MSNECKKCKESYCIEHNKLKITSLAIASISLAGIAITSVKSIVNEDYHISLSNYIKNNVRTIEETITPVLNKIPVIILNKVKKIEVTITHVMKNENKEIQQQVFTNEKINENKEIQQQVFTNEKKTIKNSIVCIKQNGFVGNIDNRIKQITYEIIDKSFGKIRSISSDAIILGNLSREITKDIKSNKLKSYALFKWVIYHITYDKSEIYSHKQTPILVVKNKKAVCVGFSNLYRQLCIDSNVECKVISGITKDILNGSPGHAWNAVRFDNEWHLVDTTWNEFDIKPEIFVKTRLATEQCNQFLNKPITRYDFLHS